MRVLIAFCAYVAILVTKGTASAFSATRVPLSMKARGESPPTICIVGGGAAGFMAASECGRILREESSLEGVEIVLLEATKDSLNKVKISGGGRCNVMHDPSKGVDFISKSYPRGEKQIKGPLTARFGPIEAQEWFTSRGVKLKTERDGRVFPTTDDSETIIRCLHSELKKYDVRLRSQCKVFAITEEEGGKDGKGPALKVCYNKQGGGEGTIMADRVIVATGSSRLGHDMLKTLGHTIVEPAPSLFSFVVKGDEALIQLAGASVINARVKIVIDKKFAGSDEGKALGLRRPNFVKSLTTEGPLLVTHQGMSGPAVLRLSSFGARVMAAMKYQFDVEVNWLHGLAQERESVFDALMKECDNQPNNKVSNFYPQFMKVAPTSVRSSVPGSGSGAVEGEFYLSKRLWHYLLQRAGIQDKGLKWNDVSKSQAAKLADELCRGRFQVSGRGKFKDEFVTAGGVTLNEVDFTSFGSKVLQRKGADEREPLLYLCGEVLDIDGVTGGFNFQNAWTSGFIAGGAAGRSLM